MTNIEDIIKLQEELNIQTAGKKWREKNLRWDFAILTEVAELLDSVGLKWWKNTSYSIKDYTYNEVVKHTDIDIENIHIELVDLFHFILSLGLSERSGADLKLLVEYNESKLLASGRIIDVDKIAILDRAKDLCLNMSMRNFFSLVKACGLSKKGLYNLYVGKNILNKFRQEHGYVSGEYKKIWHGEEDNKVMYRLSTVCGISPDGLYKALEKEYKNVGKV